jgi:thiol-disulfide isomerase/thioredoxin
MKQIGSTLVILLLVGASLFAQHPRTPLFEEFTSSTCPPCAAVKPQVDQFATENPDVVVVTYHMNWPQQGDPYNVYNPNDNMTRRSYYNVTGIPDGYMSGTKIYPGSAAALKQAANQVKMQTSPLAMTISEDRTKNPIEVRVTIKNDGSMPVSNATLQVMVINYYADLTQQLQGQSQHVYTTFEYALLKALPDANGTALTIAPNEQKSFTFTYSKGSGSLWPPNNQYVIAFVQMNSTKEVLQATSNLSLYLNRVEITASQPRFGMIARSNNLTHQLTISNPTDRAQTVSLQLNSTYTIQPQGWNVTITPSTLSLQPGEEKTATVQFTAPNTGSFALAYIDAIPQGNGINQTASYYCGYLTEQTKYAIIYGFMGSGITPFAQAIMSGAKYSSETALMPLVAATEIGNLPCQAIVLPIDYNARGALNNQAVIDEVTSWIQQKKRLFLAGPLEAYLAFNSQGANMATRNFMLNTLGIRGVRTFPITVQGQTSNVPYYHFNYDPNTGSITSLKTFTIQGVNGDPISNGVNVTANQSTQYYNLYTDVLQLAQGTTAVPIFTYDNNTQYIGGVRVETNDTRIVFTTFGLEAISNATARNQLAQKIMDWLTGTIAPQPKLELVQTTGENVIQFDQVEVGKSKAHTFKIRNSGTADLVVSEIAMDPQDAATYGDVFVITEGGQTPITIAPGSEHAVTLEFRPKKVEDIQAAVFHIRSNGGDVDLTVLGDGVQTLRIEPSEGATAGLALRVAPNPVSSEATIITNVNTTTAAELVLLDTRGSEVLRVANSITGQRTLSFDVSSVPSGVYRLMLRSGSEHISVPLIVIK